MTVSSRGLLSVCSFPHTCASSHFYHCPLILRNSRVLSLCNFYQCLFLVISARFKALYTCKSHIWVTFPVFSELQSCVSNCLLSVSTWISNKHLKFIIFQTDLFNATQINKYTFISSPQAFSSLITVTHPFIQAKIVKIAFLHYPFSFTFYFQSLKVCG